MNDFKPTVCLDFDGVIHSYTSPWTEAEVIPDPPVPGAKEAITELRQVYRVVVNSSRCSTLMGRKAVQEWLNTYGITADEVSATKPPAMVCLDDRAVRFTGDWKKAVTDIAGFEHWRVTRGESHETHEEHETHEPHE